MDVCNQKKRLQEMVVGNTLEIPNKERRIKSPIVVDKIQKVGRLFVAIGRSGTLGNLTVLPFYWHITQICYPQFQYEEGSGKC
jgi:hypothetical protein